MVEVHAVTQTDAMTWARLRHRLWPEHTLEELSVQVREFFDAGTPLIAAAFLAWDGGTPVGFVELSVRPYVPGAASLPVPFVEGWFVEPEWRLKGVGRMLVRAAEDWARSMGFRQLGSDALVDNALAFDAHRALGFRTVETIRCFIKELDDAT